jgi:Heparinase II/III-like protein
MAGERRRGRVIIAPPMGSLPFLTAVELDAARGRWERRQPGDPASLLHENVERILRTPAFESPLRLRTQNNLFHAQGILLESSLVFRLSGDPRYLEPVMRCVLEVADDELRRERLPGEVHPAFVLVGLAVAYELCGEAIDRALIEATTATIVAELHDGAEREPWGERVPKRHAWNHAAVAFAAIGCGGLLCRGVDPRAERWIDTAVERLLLFFAYGITEHGMGREGLSYCGFVFRNAAPFLLAARNAGIWDYRSLEQNPYLERLRLVPRWYAIETFPGGSWQQAVNDSYWSPLRAMCGFLPTFGALDPSLTAWVYAHLLGERAEHAHGRHRGAVDSSLFESVLWPPVPASVSPLPEVLADEVVGYLAERVYDEPRSGFSFNCGEFIGGIHDQSDNGSITLFAGDAPLLIDSGAANEPVEGSPSSSHGHCLVLIDGRGQVPSGRGVGCTGRIVQAERHTQATVLTADLTDSYAARGYNPVKHAIRHCVFGKRPFTYLLVVDDFSRPRGERAAFEQIFHTPPVAESQLTASGLRMRIAFEGASRALELRPLDDGVEVEQGSFKQHDVALFAEHPVWRLRRSGGQLVMPTLLLPYAAPLPREARAPSDDSTSPETPTSEVLSSFDPRTGRVTLEWRAAGREGVDALELTPGAPVAAVFTRNGVRLDSAERLLGHSATPVAPSF